MRKLVFILIGFIAVVTFLRAYDNSSGINAGDINTDGRNSGTLVIQGR